MQSGSQECQRFGTGSPHETHSGIGSVFRLPARVNPDDVVAAACELVSHPSPADSRRVEGMCLCRPARKGLGWAPPKGQPPLANRLL